jgi:hypothetical protein
VDPQLLSTLKASKLETQEELEDLGKQLKSVLGYGAHIARRGFIGRGKFQTLSAHVGDHGFRAEVYGGKPHFYMGESIRGVTTTYAEVTKAEWLTALTDEIISATK